MESKRYRKPPLTERVVSVSFDMDEEPFQTKLESWNGVMRTAFPESAIITRWEVQLAEKNGMPYMPSDKQRMTTKYQFWPHKGQPRDRCIQVWRDRISFNLISPFGNPRTFEDLQAIFTEWYPKWASHFGIRTVRGVRLEYVNILSANTLPTFCHEGRIDIGKILTTFCAPGPLKNLIPPFAFQYNFDATTADFPMRVQADLTNQKTNTLALRLLLMATTEGSARKVPLDDIQRELNTAHEIILKEFEAFFTENAKTSFEPI